MHVPDESESLSDGSHFSPRFLKPNWSDPEVKVEYHTTLEEQMQSLPIPDITVVASANEAERLVNSRLSTVVSMMHATARTATGTLRPK